jgi:hypothetical protein
MLQPFVVPTFGSNGMLYLLSYLFWRVTLLVLLVRASQMGKARGRLVQIALPAGVLSLMPAQFLNWAAIWLTGVGLVAFCESKQWRPPPLLGIAASLVRCSLVFAVAAALLQQPLMQQPTPARYAAFLVIVCLSIAVKALAAHAFAAVLERIYITIISFLKSISLRMLKRE